MDFVSVARQEKMATVTIARGKVNAVEESVVAELSSVFCQLNHDSQVTSVVLTGQGKFFSFGFDVPELCPRSRKDMEKFVRSFCSLSRDLFLFPKPIVAAVNGHAIAGGCILALACDYRIMISGGAKMGLNEVAIGASLFASAVEMLRFAVGSRNAEHIALSGTMFGGEEALKLGLADQLVASSELSHVAEVKARDMVATYGPAYVSLKNLLKRPIADEWMLREDQSIREWLNIWYLPETQERVKEVQIR